MKKQTAGIIALFLAASLALTACSAGAKTTSAAAAKVTKVSDQKDTVIQPTDTGKVPASAKSRKDTFVATISEPGGVFLPYFYDNGWDGNAVQPIFSSLVTTDENGKVIPDLAEKWDISSDNLTYTFHLRSGLKFSDGSPLTAADVAFTLTLLDDPAYSAGGIDITAAHIKGADEYRKGSAQSVSGIQVTNPQTIQITTTQVNPLNLTTLGVQVLSKAYYGKSYKKGKLDYLKSLYSAPLGSGPYKLDKYVVGQEIRYSANPNYYGGKPSIGHLIFKVTSKATALQAFQTGETDYDGFTTDNDTLEQLKSLGFAGIKIRTVADYGVIAINNKRPYLKDTAVRQALIYGLNRQEIIDVKYKGFGEVANVFASPNLWSYTEDGVTKYSYDPEKAKQLLDSLGWKTGSDGIRTKDGQRFKLSYLTSKSDDPVIPIAKDCYKKIGIEFVPEVLDSNTMFNKLTKFDYDLMGFRTNGLIDPNDSVAEFASDNQNNNYGYSDKAVDQLLKDGVSTLDTSKRKEIYKKLYQELSKNPPLILLDYRKSIAAWNSRVKGAENYTTGDGDSAIKLAKLTISQ